MEVSPARALFSTFQRPTYSWAWCVLERRPNFLFSSNAAVMTSGSPPPNLMPSAPFLALARTHSRAASGVVISSLERSPVKLLPNQVYASIRGAVISFLLLFSFWSSTQSMPFPEPGSQMVVIPWPIQSLKTYSAGVPCELPPIWAWVSTNPGSRYMPSAFSSLPPSLSLGLPFESIAIPGKPTTLTEAMRLFSTTISTGPIGGDRVPSITVTPRMMSCDQGPSPSALGGAFSICE